MKLVILIALLLCLIFAGALTVVAVKKLHRLDTYKDDILSEMKKSLNREVQYGRGGFSLHYGPSFTFEKVLIRERDPREHAAFLSADRISLRLALAPLLFNKVVIKKVVLEKPSIRLHRYHDGTFNITDLLTEKKERPIQVKALYVEKGALTIQDDYIHESPVVYAVYDLDLYLGSLTRGKRGKLNLSAFVKEQTGRSELNVRGKLKLAPDDQPFVDSVFDGHVKAKNVHAERYWNYYRRYVPFEKILGHLDVESDFKGKLREFETEGMISIRDLRFSYPGVFRSALTPRTVQLKYHLNLDSRDLTIKDIDVHIDGFRAQGSCAVLDMPGRDPRIVAHAATSAFKLESCLQYIPFGIIPDDTSHFIETKIKAGTIRLDDGRLDGRVSQIAHMEEGDNCRVLSIHGTMVDGGLIRLSDQIPLFNGIRGKLILEGKNFTLKNMSGKFGTSPFTLNGAITDYCLKTPVSYPFAMVMTPQSPEVAWLMGKNAGNKLMYSGKSTLRLNGRGESGNYQLFGDWHLKDVAYQYNQLVVKPAGKDNRMTFSGRVDDAGFHVTSLKYDLPPLSVNLSGKYAWGEKEDLLIRVDSNRFRIENMVGFFPVLKEYQPKGMVKIGVTGEGGGADPSLLYWSGQLSMTGLSFVPGENIKTVSGINGSVHLKGTTLETSSITARLGTSPVTVQGSVTNFRDPSMRVDFLCPNLEFSDLGLTSPDPRKKLTDVKGNFFWHGDNLDINTLSGRIDNTTLNVKGTIRDLKKPVISLQGTSPYLEIEDLLTLAGIRKAETDKEESGPSFILKAGMAAERGKWRNVSFEKLRADLNYKSKRLNFSKLAFNTLNGKVSAKGEVDFNLDQPRYNTNFTCDKLSAEELMKAMGRQERMMTGSLEIEGALTAQGETMADLKKTVQGNVSLKATKGMLRQFPALSKIFSILNVSQLFKFQLPDMVSGGMPYSEITGNFNFHDGFVSTTDLFVKSDAMNIALVGRIDMIREEGDATIGIQPLQTVDKLVSGIPIIGWIITGREGTFVTAYFETKGKLSDPTVTAIPFQSMATGVFDIFKRVFQLPVKIFTDTGEVLIGK
ncbi:MAG TPA: AsmA-like C-terminal domain-containing protein [Syntrophales bacterium]|nr:AsmA-like C-terminal domain-containing protein [Syntrophales bacterium]